MNVNSQLNLPISEMAKEMPVFCLTTDIDWAPDWAIQDIFDLVDRYDIPLTPFITHDSSLISKRYGQTAVMKQRVGLHPNFLPGSTHGSTTEEVIDHVISLWPDAKCFRSHSFFEHAGVTSAFAQRDFLYDSNIALHLQPKVTPLQHISGLLRFPVVWTDHSHLIRGRGFDTSQFETWFSSPGLKIIDIHPMHIALNSPTVTYYQDHKFLYDEQDLGRGAKFKWAGLGIGNFVDELLAYVKGKKIPVFYLDDIYSSYL